MTSPSIGKFTNSKKIKSRCYKNCIGEITNIPLLRSIGKLNKSNNVDRNEQL